MNVEFFASSSIEGPGRPVVHGNDVWCAAISNRNQQLKVDLGTQMSNITFFKLIVKQEFQQSFNQYDSIIKKGLTNLSNISAA